MSSKALQIRDAIIALLTTPALTGIGAGGVSVDPDYAFEMRDLPAVAVYLGDEQAPQRVMIGSVDRQVILTVRIISKGDDVFANADALQTACFSRVMADMTLGGLVLDIQEQGTRRSRDVLQAPVGITELDFAVDYRTTPTSLEI